MFPNDVCPQSFFSQLEPRLKLVTTLLFVLLAVALTSPLLLFSLFAFCLGISCGLAQLPLKFLGKRFLYTLPFTGAAVFILPFLKPGVACVQIGTPFFTLVATFEGLTQGFTLALRVLSAVTIIATFASTTSWLDFLRALSFLGVPREIVQLIGFTVRYLFVLKEELGLMRQACAARCFSPGKNFWHRQTMQVTGELLGGLFLRALARGERVYEAMLARGYTGSYTFCTCSSTFRKPDYWWCVGFAGSAFLLIFLDLGGLQWLLLLR